MKGAIAASVVAAVVVVGGATAGGANWKSQVQTDCHRLVVTSLWTVRDARDGSVGQRRLGRLTAKAKACGFALTQVPAKDNDDD